LPKFNQELVSLQEEVYHMHRHKPQTRLSKV